MIECKFIPIPKYREEMSTAFRKLDGEEEDPRKYNKLGRYHNSIYPVEGLGVTSWLLCGYIGVDYEELEKEGKSQEDIAKECVEFLNVLPKRKLYSRKKSKPKYGTLELLKYKFMIHDDKPCMSVILTTSDRSNSKFWGKGETSYVRKETRGRKKIVLKLKK